MDVLFEGDRAVGVTVQGADGELRDVRARVVVDASGQAGLIQNRFSLRIWDPVLNKGRDLDLLGRRLPRHRPRRGRHHGAPDRRTSKAGSGTSRSTTTSSASASSRRSTICSRTAVSFEQTYEEEVERCRAVKERIASARRATGYFATKDYSYRATRVSGDGWVMIGDAWGFLDPLYSSGVLLALRSGEMAADAIVEGLADGRHVGAQLGKWGPLFNEGVDRMRRLVCEYYAGFSFGNFMRRHPGAARHGHRSADRRSVQRSRRQGLGADGGDVSARQDADPGVERRHQSGRRAAESQRADSAGSDEAVTSLRESINREAPIANR